MKCSSSSSSWNVDTIHSTAPRSQDSLSMFVRTSLYDVCRWRLSLALSLHRGGRYIASKRNSIENRRLNSFLLKLCYRDKNSTGRRLRLSLCFSREPVRYKYMSREDAVIYETKGRSPETSLHSSPHTSYRERIVQKKHLKAIHTYMHVH